jgi:hypothetical protein
LCGSMNPNSLNLIFQASEDGGAKHDSRPRLDYRVTMTCSTAA